MIEQDRHATLKGVLTIGEAAELLGVHPDTLRNWDRAGKLTARRRPINGYRLYYRTALEKLAEVLNPNHVTKDQADG